MSNKPSSALSDHVAIITGGSSGIGRALAEELALRGCDVVIADRQIDLGREVEERIKNLGGRAHAVELDVRDLDAFKAIAKETVRRSRRIDFLFNNAGIGVGGEMDTYEREDFDDVFDVNLRGVAYGIQAVYPIMIQQRSGHIINTASVAGLVASGGAGSYTATKHAVVGLSKALRIEAHRHNVRVSALCPGAIRTPILTGGKYGRVRIDGASKEAIMRQWEKTRPMDPAVFAKKVVERVLANDPIIVVPGWWKAFWLLDRLSPSLSLYVWRRMQENLRRDMERDGVSFDKKGSAEERAREEEQRERQRARATN